MDSPRTALRAQAILNAERLAVTTVDAALDPDADPLKRADLALRILDAVDPRTSAQLTASVDLDPETASLGQLMALAESQGISLERPA